MRSLLVLFAALQVSLSLLRTNTRIVRLTSDKLLVRREATTTSTSSSSTSTTTTPSSSSDCECNQFADTFVAQKNFILLEKFERPENGNLTDAAMQYVNFCDESFDLFLNEKIALLPTETEKQKYEHLTHPVTNLSHTLSAHTISTHYRPTFAYLPNRREFYNQFFNTDNTTLHFPF